MLARSGSRHASIRIALTMFVVALSLHAAPSASPARGEESTSPSPEGWRWPVEVVRLVRPYEAPAHTYGPGHRGVDLAVPDAQQILAPADGVVAFAGPVAGRGVVTIAHGAGLVTTLEPIVPTVGVGVTVARGEPVGVIGEGGHTPPGVLHFGVRRDGEYINPLTLLGGVPRAVLLPCC